MGRPTLLTPDVQARIVEAIERGNTHKTAAQYGGIEDETFYEWMARGRGERKDRPCTPEYAEFAQQIEKAELKAKMDAVDLVQLGGLKNWTAAMCWLERRYPDEWGRRDRLDLGGQKDNPIRLAVMPQQILEGMSSDDRVAFARIGRDLARRSVAVAHVGDDKPSGNGSRSNGGPPPDADASTTA